jgi:putative sterol carrier protein
MEVNMQEEKEEVKEQTKEDLSSNSHIKGLPVEHLGEEKECSREITIPQPKEEEVKEEKKEKLERPKTPSNLSQDRPKLSPETMYQVAEEFSKRVFSIPNVYEKLKASKLIVRMKYFDEEQWKDVEPEVTVDCTGDEVNVVLGESNIKPDVTMYMHADVAHRFWMQKLNIMAAIMKGEIKVHGPMHKAMKLLPTLKPSFEVYKNVLKELGYEELLNYPE